MKYIKKILLVFVSIIIIFFIYDLADYDSNYLNRKNFFFDKNNLNNKYKKNIYSIYKNFKNKFEYNFFWEVEQNRSGTLVNNQAKIIKNNEFKIDKINVELEGLNFDNWNRSNGNNSSTRFSF